MSTYILNTFKISYMIKNNVSLLIGMRRMTIAETARLAGVSYNTRNISIFLYYRKY